MSQLFEQSLAANVVVFLLAGLGVWVAGTRLTSYADTLGDRLGLGQAFMGMVFLAGVTELPEVKAGDVATVIGGPADQATSLSAVAERCGTIAYEILTGLTQRLPRRYMHEGVVISA